MRTTEQARARVHSFFPFQGGGFGALTNPWLDAGFVQNQLPLLFPYVFPGMGLPGAKPAGGGVGVGKAAAAQQPAAVPGSIWEQLGGLDGIITHMGKVQKIMQMAQSMSPLMKLFTQSSVVSTAAGVQSGMKSAVKASKPRGGKGHKAHVGGHNGGTSEAMGSKAKSGKSCSERAVSAGAWKSRASGGRQAHRSSI